MTEEKTTLTEDEITIGEARPLGEVAEPEGDTDGDADAESDDDDTDDDADAEDAG